MFDVIIIGGGTAGLSAALVLGRSRRRVLVCDAGQPRNSPSSAVHSFFSRDGIAPAQLLLVGREQLLPYTTVEVRPLAAVDAVYADGYYQVTLADDTQVSARRLLLATGVRDELPEIEGFAELWGQSVYHCPYCHGWEVRDQPLAVYGNGEQGVELALLISNWSRDLVLCTNGPADIGMQQRMQLVGRGIILRDEPIVRLEKRQRDDEGDLMYIVFANGEVLSRRGLFFRPKQRQHSHLPERLGCTFTGSGAIAVDESGWTGVPGLYAAGDAAQLLQQVAFAAASGARAAIAINIGLIQDEVQQHEAE